MYSPNIQIQLWKMTFSTILDCDVHDQELENLHNSNKDLPIS